MNSHPEQKSLLKRLQLRLAQARFLTLSMLIHVVIVITCGSLVFIQHIEEETTDFAAPGGELFTTETPVELPKDSLVIPTNEFQPTPPAASAPTLPTITTSNMSQPFVVAPTQPIVKPVLNPKETIIKPPTVAGVNPSLPSIMKQRMGGTSRTAAMALNKGKPKSEEAVHARPALAGEEPERRRLLVPRESAGDDGLRAAFVPRPRRDCRRRRSLARRCRRPSIGCGRKAPKVQGRLSMTKGGWGASSGVYEHAIAAYALGEYYTMTKDERVAPLLKQAIEYIVQGQGPDGGWMYHFDKSQSDTSVSGWQIQALKAAHLSELEIDGVDAALDKAMLNLKRVQGNRGGFGYRAAEDRYSLTGVGVLCTYFWKQEKDELVRDGIKFILDKDQPRRPLQRQQCGPLRLVLQHPGLPDGWRQCVDKVEPHVSGRTLHRAKPRRQLAAA